MERRPTRSDSHDYTSAGAYFVTIVTRDRVPLFGSLLAGDMRLNDAGLAVRDAWMDLGRRFPLVETDTLVVMPDHVHGILWLIDPLAVTDRGPASGAPTSGGGPDDRDPASGAFSGVGEPDDRVPALPDVVRAFKSLSAIEVNRIMGRSGAVWQRSFYERFVRNERELSRFRRYITENPQRADHDHAYM